MKLDFKTTDKTASWTAEAESIKPENSPCIKNDAHVTAPLKFEDDAIPYIPTIAFCILLMNGDRLQ